MNRLNHSSTMNSPYGQRSQLHIDSYTVAPLRGIHTYTMLYTLYIGIIVS
jgi:hypothetical protein